ALVTTGCGYFPIGAWPTGYLPIGALPTGGAGGGGSLRGRSAAAAAPSIAKDAASAVTIFSMFSPLNFAPFSRSGDPRSKIKMPKQSESHNRKRGFSKAPRSVFRHVLHKHHAAFAHFDSKSLYPAI